MTLTLLTLALMNVAAHDASLSGSEIHYQGLLLAQNDAPPPPPPLEGAPPMPGNAYDSWSLEQLQRESMRLNSMKPSLAGPIVLLSVGGGIALVLGLPFTFYGLAAVGLGFGYGLLAVGLVFLLPGIAMAIGGGIWLASRISERRDYDHQLEDIDLRIRSRSMPPPATGAPAVDLFRPAPAQVVLARF